MHQLEEHLKRIIQLSDLLPEDRVDPHSSSPACVHHWSARVWKNHHGWASPRLPCHICGHQPCQAMSYPDPTAWQGQYHTGFRTKAHIAIVAYFWNVLMTQDCYNQPQVMLVRPDNWQASSVCLCLVTGLFQRLCSWAKAWAWGLLKSSHC